MQRRNRKSEIKSPKINHNVVHLKKIEKKLLRGYESASTARCSSKLEVLIIISHNY